MRIRYLRLTTLLIVGSLAHASVAADNDRYIFEVPVERSADSRGALGNYIEATLDYPDPAQAAAQIAASGAVDILQVTDQQVVIGVASAATTTTELDAKNLAATFVVDFDEESVASSARILRDAYGDQPQPGEIENFVFEYIDDKSYRGTFDLASKVAATRSGDCTEHAVLLTALARAHELPARLVFGVLLLSRDDSVQGYGHAWTEIHHDGAWRLLDSTLPMQTDEFEEAFYLPLMTMKDEGPGYGLDFMRLVNVQPVRISNIHGIDN